MGRKCNKCGISSTKRKKVIFKIWNDYSRKETLSFCILCWNDAVKIRKRGFTMRSALGIVNKVKVAKLKGKANAIWQQRYKKNMKRKLGMCEMCKSKEELEIHHYTHKSKGGKDSEDNYIVLCKKCHGIFHPNHRRFKKGEETQNGTE